MGKASLFIAAALVALLAGGAVGVYAYDSARDDVIAEGIAVGGVDVGGMSADQARKVLRYEIKDPLRKPVRVKAGGERFTLTAADTKIETNVDRMVDDALAESRDGNVLSRTVRDLAGGSVDLELPARVTYSRAAVKEVVAEVEEQVERPAQDASVEPSASGLQTAPARSGLDVQGGKLQDEIVAALESPAGDRVVEATVQKVKPEVTSGELAQTYPHYLTVDRSSFQLRHFRNLKLQKTYEIAVGRVGFDTPAGLYEIQNKAVDPAWSVPEWGGALAGKVIPGGTPQNPLKERWLGIYDGAGIHGTDDVASLGTAASHGCIRMTIPEVIELYDRVPIGTPIYIQ